MARGVLRLVAIVEAIANGQEQSLVREEQHPAARMRGILLRFIDAEDDAAVGQAILLQPAFPDRGPVRFLRPFGEGDVDRAIGRKVRIEEDVVETAVGLLKHICGPAWQPSRGSAVLPDDPDPAVFFADQEAAIRKERERPWRGKGWSDLLDFEVVRGRNRHAIDRDRFLSRCLTLCRRLRADCQN